MVIPFLMPIVFAIYVKEKTPFTKIIGNPGCISTVYGLPETGKTNFMCFIMDNATTWGINCFSIINFFTLDKVPEACREGLIPKGITYKKKPDEIRTVKQVSDLLIGLLENKPSMTILDEAGIFASTRAPMSKRLRYILNLSYIIRHLQSSFVYVTQTKASIPPEMREALVRYEMVLQKVNKTYRTLVIKKRKTFFDDFGNERVNFLPIDAIGRLPLTRLPWDGHYIPKFTFDIDLDKTWDKLGDLKDSLEVRKHGASVIREMKREAEAEVESKAKKPKEEVYAEVRELYLTLEDSGIFRRKSDLVSHIAEGYEKSYTWALQIVKSLPFDKTKYTPRVES